MARGKGAAMITADKDETFLSFSGKRFTNDTALITHVEKTARLLWRGQLMPSNFSAIEHRSRDNYLYKCPQCPSFGEQSFSGCCTRSTACCEQYYLVFQSPPGQRPHVERRVTTCCSSQPTQCTDRQSQWYAVDASLRWQDFDAAQHLLPLQVEQNYIVADHVAKSCAQCTSLGKRYAGAAQWRSCATCCDCAPIDTDLVRDSLVRIGIDGSKYWQYKPRARTEADRVHGIYGQSVFRGQGPCGYLPDHRRRSTPVRGGYVPANMAPRAVSAVMVPRLCDESSCRTAL